MKYLDLLLTIQRLRLTKWQQEREMSTLAAENRRLREQNQAVWVWLGLPAEASLDQWDFTKLLRNKYESEKGEK